MKMFKNRKIVQSLIVVLMVTLLLVACGEKQEKAATLEELKAKVDMNKVIAEYEGTELTYGRLLEQLEAEDILRPGFADAAVADIEGVLTPYAEQLVVHKKLYDEAVAAGIVANEEEIQGELDYIKTLDATISDEELEKVKFLSSYYNILVNYLGTKVTDDETKTFYDENNAEFTTASVRHILIGFEGRTEEEAKTLADDLTSRIRQGEDMAALATEYTEDPGSKENGGLYENEMVMKWVAEFKQAALDQELNVVGDPVKTSYGYHVIRVEDRQIPEYEDVSEMIKNSIVEENFMEYMTNAEGKVKNSL